MEPVSVDKSRATYTRYLVFGLVAVATACAYFLFADQISLEYLARQETALRSFQQGHPVVVYLVAFSIYVAVTGLSIPGATGLTLLYAWFFGFFPALILVSFASTAGATLAFLLSRYLFRDAIQRRFAENLKSFNAALDREGAFYLFTLRLIPAVPFFVINVVMGLTHLRVVTFWWVSQLGMLAGTCVYVYAGSSIPGLQQLADPSLLRAADLLDSVQLVQLVSESSENEIGRHIRAQMSSTDRHWIDHIRRDSGSLTPEQEAQLTSLLNSVLTNPNMSLHRQWHEFFLRDPSRMATDTGREENRLTDLNRHLLVVAFPTMVRPPQPIVSPRLLIAFCLLGLFPLAVKRLMPWIKSRLQPT